MKDTAKHLELNSNNPHHLSKVGKAFSSPIRIEIIKHLHTRSLNVNEIAEALNIPPSSAAMHIRVLEEANLITTKQLPGERGTMKLCSRRYDQLSIRLMDETPFISDLVSVDMPIGSFTDCHIVPTCGIGTEKGYIAEDTPIGFFRPERAGAQIIWTSAGYVEYKFPNIVPSHRTPTQLSFSMELCSEAPNYKEDWKSDITLWVNGHNCGTWTSPGDFGRRRGRLTPTWIVEGSTQYGILTTWSIDNEGCFINKKKASNFPLSHLNIMDNPFITMRIGNDPASKYVGGFNLFGDKCGDYAQSIIMTIGY